MIQRPALSVKEKELPVPQSLKLLHLSSQERKKIRDFLIQEGGRRTQKKGRTVVQYREQGKERVEEEGKACQRS